MNVDNVTNYLLKVECKYCGTEVYPHEEDARDEAENIVESCGGDADIEEVRSMVTRVCDGCNHMLTKDD